MKRGWLDVYRSILVGSASPAASQEEKRKQTGSMTTQDGGDAGDPDLTRMDENVRKCQRGALR